MRNVKSPIHKDRSGVALAFVGLLLFIFMGMAALAVDLGMLLAARTEAQRVADAAALSGALSLLESPGDVARARTMARDIAALNDIRNTAAAVLDADVDVELSRDRVRVRVLRTAARGTPLINLFARVFGFGTSNVTAVGAAHAAAANGVNCPLPFVVIDRWWESPPNRLATGTDVFNRGVDIYNEGPIAAFPGSPSLRTGYGVPDRGSVLRIYPGDPSATHVPGWYYPIVLAGCTGANCYRDHIENCVNPNTVFEYGMSVDIEPGGMVGPTQAAFNNLIGQDPTAYWGTGPNSPAGGCVFRPGAVDSSGNQVCVSSPRVRPAFLVNPAEAPTSPGRQAITLRNFVGLFVICVGTIQPSQATCTGNLTGPATPNKGVHVRFVDYRGIGTSGTPRPGSLIKTLQLVE